MLGMTFPKSPCGSWVGASPSRLPGAYLLFLLCGHHVAASSEGEDPSVSPAGWFRSVFRCLFRCTSCHGALSPWIWGVRAGARGAGGLVHPVCSTLAGAVVGVPFPGPARGPGSHPCPLVGTGGERVRQWSCAIP